MADSEHPSRFNVEACMTLDRIEDGANVGTVSISSNDDGSLRIASTGRLPGRSLRDLRRLREGLQLFARVTQQDASVVHNGRHLADVRASSSGAAKLSIRWWSVLRSGIDRIAGRD